MDRNERTVESACGIIRTEGMTVPKTVKDSIARCLNDEAVFDFAVVYVAGARAGYRSMHKIERSEDDPYCYEGTKTPVNKLNIRDYEVLRTKMRDVVPIRIAELEKHPIVKEMSSDYLRSIHRHLYGDLFQWAGEYRTVDYPNDPTACRTEYIGSCVDDIFKEMKKKDFLSKSDDFCGDLAHMISELYAIRPFRLGNGVAIKVLANCIAILNGRYLDYSDASESLLDVAIKMGVAGDTSHLEALISEIIEDY